MLALWLTVALLCALVCFLHGFNGISNIEHHTGASASEVSGLNSTFHTVDAMANATSYALVKGGSAASAVVQAMGKFSHVAVQILNNCSSAPYAVANLNKTLPYVTSHARGERRFCHVPARPGFVGLLVWPLMQQHHQTAAAVHDRQQRQHHGVCRVHQAAQRHQGEDRVLSASCASL